MYPQIRRIRNECAKAHGTKMACFKEENDCNHSGLPKDRTTFIIISVNHRVLDCYFDALPSRQLILPILFLRILSMSNSTVL